MVQNIPHTPTNSTYTFPAKYNYPTQLTSATPKPPKPPHMPPEYIPRHDSSPFPPTVLRTSAKSISPYFFSTCTLIGCPEKNVVGTVNVRLNFVRAAERRRETVMRREDVGERCSVIGCFDLMRASSVRRRVERWWVRDIVLRI